MQARNLRRSAANDLFSLAELDWFSKNTYNMALRFCTSWSPEATLRLVQSCLKVGQACLWALNSHNCLVHWALPRCCRIQHDGGLVSPKTLLQLLVRFIVDCACSARSKHRTSGYQSTILVLTQAYYHQLQHYINLRKAIDDFRADVKGQINRLEGGAKSDLKRKHASLLAFDYEAAARLKSWDSFNRIIRVCQAHCHLWTHS